MEMLISEACRRPLGDLRGHQFDLVGPNGDIILPSTWELNVQPGWTITIVFVEPPLPVPTNETYAAHRSIIQRLEHWDANQEENLSGWEAERQRERESWQEERNSERLRWEENRQRERGMVGRR